jgi:5-methylcytosine-specific restriction endonuclease McrA
MNITDKHNCLKLNASWLPVGTSTVADAIIDLVGGVNSKVIDIQYAMKDDGTPDFANIEYMNDVTWEEWIQLPVMPWHDAVHSPRLTIRAPTVIIARNCKHMPKKKFRNTPSKEGVWIRDKGIDQYTGKKLRKDEASTDHVVPRSKGGQDIWTNVLLTHKDVNREKGNRLNHEIGYIPLSKPTRPNDIELCLTIREARCIDWRHFLVVRDDV